MSARAALVILCAALGCGDKAPQESAGPDQGQVVAAPKSTPETPSQPGVPTTSAPEKTTYESKYPVKSSNAAALELSTASDAHAQYTRDEPELFGELERDGTKVRPKNCSEWAELKAKDFEPSSGVEEAPDSGAKLRCLTLKLLESGKAAASSHVRDLSWDRKMLAILPVEVATTLQGDDDRAVAAARAAGKSFGQFDRKARVKPSTDKEMLEVVEGSRQTMILMYPMAWGDFDGDGVDDVAVAVTNGATHGTLAYTRLLTLTRIRPTETLTVIESR